MVDIYLILSNLHYVKRYCNFIEYCKKENQNLSKKSKYNPNGVYLESHHILPKARDMFPEYSNFKQNPWNKINLTARQH